MSHGDADRGQLTLRSSFYDQGKFGRLFPRLPPFASDTPRLDAHLRHRCHVCYDRPASSRGSCGNYSLTAACASARILEKRGAGECKERHLKLCLAPRPTKLPRSDSKHLMEMTGRKILSDAISESESSVRVSHSMARSTHFCTR
jgi:hypothetical protein